MAAALRRVPRGARSFFLSGKPAVLRRTIHTSVWWDFTTCEIPKGGDAVSVVGNINEALAKLGYVPATLSVYGDWDRGFSSLDDFHALSKTGVQVKCMSIEPIEPNLGSKQLLHDIWLWIKDSPAPSNNCLIISSDEDLSFALHQLRMRGYDILLAKHRTRKASGTMEAVAKTVWQWTSLRVGGPPERASQ